MRDDSSTQSDDLPHSCDDGRLFATFGDCFKASFDGPELARVEMAEGERVVFPRPDVFDMQSRHLCRRDRYRRDARIYDTPAGAGAQLRKRSADPERLTVVALHRLHELVVAPEHGVFARELRRLFEHERRAGRARLARSQHDFGMGRMRQQEPCVDEVGCSARKRRAGDVVDSVVTPAGASSMADSRKRAKSRARRSPSRPSPRGRGASSARVPRPDRRLDEGRSGRIAARARRRWSHRRRRGSATVVPRDRCLRTCSAEPSLRRLGRRAHVTEKPRKRRAGDRRSLLLGGMEKRPVRRGCVTSDQTS